MYIYRDVQIAPLQTGGVGLKYNRIFAVHFSFAVLTKNSTERCFPIQKINVMIVYNAFFGYNECNVWAILIPYILFIALLSHAKIMGS